MAGYIPSREEVQAAEATMMPAQAELTEQCELARSLLRDMGVEGMLESSEYGDGTDYDPRTDEVTGRLNGHDITVMSIGITYRGSIDGNEMSFHQAREVWRKYAEVGHLVTTAAINEARRGMVPLDPAHAEAADLLRDIL